MTVSFIKKIKSAHMWGTRKWQEKKSYSTDSKQSTVVIHEHIKKNNNN